MITIRPAQTGDCHELVLLCHELGYAISAEALAQQFTQLQDHPDHAIFVAEIGSTPTSASSSAPASAPVSTPKISGWVHVHLHCTLQEGHEAAIGGLVVSQQVRGQGIGKRLMQQAEVWAQEKGCHAVVLSSNVQRREAHQFYRRVGYREVKRSIIFRQSLAPAELREEISANTSAPNAQF